jgi:hypothetical protein
MLDTCSGTVIIPDCLDHDPLGPVSFTEAQTIRADQDPTYNHPTRSRPVSWTLRARTSEAKTLCAELVWRVEEAEGPGRQRDKLVAGVEAFIGSLMLHAYSGSWSAQAMGNEALATVPMGGFRLTKVRNVLTEAGLIDVLRGYFDVEWGGGQSTKFRATPALLRLASTHGVNWRDAWRHFGWIKERSPDVPHEDAVLLRTHDRSRLLLPETADAARLVEDVVAFNDFTRHFAVTYGPEDDTRSIGPQFQRIFTGDLEKHGRWYVVGGGYQGLPACRRGDRQGNLFSDYSRRTLRIDGEPCVELDVRASHLTIIHGLAGVPLPTSGDPYAVVEDVPREVAKAWVSSRIGQGRSPSHWSRDAVEDLRTKHGIDLDRFSVAEVGKAIRDAMPFVGRGLPALLGVQDEPKLSSHVLMGIEARALTRAMLSLKDEAILGLPLHDALIIQERHAERARAALEAGYRAEAGITPIIRVRRGVEAQ